MKVFKTFDEFIAGRSLNESQLVYESARFELALLNEADMTKKVSEKMSVKSVNPEIPGEIARYELYIKDKKSDMEQLKKTLLSEGQADLLQVIQSDGKVKGPSVAFIDAQQKEHKGFLGIGANVEYTAVISIFDAKGFDAEKLKTMDAKGSITLGAPVGEIKFYNVDIMKLAAKPETLSANSDAVNILKQALAAATTQSQAQQAAGQTGEVPGPESWLKDVTPAQDVLDYLKEKTVKAGPIQKGSTSNAVKFLQAILKDQAWLTGNGGRYAAPAAEMQKQIQNVNGQYDSATANAFGRIFKNLVTELPQVTEADITILAKYLSQLGMTKPALEALWKGVESGTSGTSGTSGKAAAGSFSGLAKSLKYNASVQDLQKKIIALGGDGANTIKSKGGADGKYGDATATAVGQVLGTGPVATITDDIAKQLNDKFKDLTQSQIDAVQGKKPATNTQKKANTSDQGGNKPANSSGSNTFKTPGGKSLILK